MPQKSVVLRKDCIYLKVGGDWFYYNFNSPPLGHGSMGTVYLGRSTNYGNKVAIKQVAKSIQDNPSVRSRARLEGNMRFCHHNLVEMIGFCEYDPIHQKGPIWIISKLVNGINLDDHVCQNLQVLNDSLYRIIDTIYPVLDALSFLHSFGVYHLDVKPSNIMVENGNNIRLMDLGICSQGITSVVQTTGLLGTPQFAAPEQFHFENDNNRINETTDIHQAGITLYQLLTNRNPFHASSIHDCMKLHSTIMLPYCDEVVPRRIVDVLRKATNPNQGLRYQTVEDFKKALQSAVLYEKNKPKRKLRLIIGLSFIIALITGIIFLILHAYE